MKQRDMTTTNHVSTVIDVLQLGKKTGHLLVEREADGTHEEGTLVFMHGQVVQASIGIYKGKDAMTRLLAWQACRFAFTPTSADRIQEQPPLLEIHPNRKKSIENSHKLFYGDVKSLANSSNTEDQLNLRPLLNVYKEALDEIFPSLEQNGFSRLHRRLFLLIDGRRSLRDLAMLLGRTPNETIALLTELEEAGFIKLS
jgi:hypothetical protein